jgi:uncharacterized protein YbcI
VRQMAADEFCAATEEIVGRKVVALLGDHNAVANTTVLLFLLERAQPQRAGEGGDSTDD